MMNTQVFHTKHKMDRLSILNDYIARFEERYTGPKEGGLCRTPNVSQIAAYDGWVKERDALSNYTTRDIDNEIAKLRRKEAELRKTRDNLLIEEVHRLATAAVPPAMAQVANALMAVHTEHEVKLETLFGIQSPEVNTAGLMHVAEWRDPETIEMFLKNGADVNFKDARGFSVLEMVLQGHDGYWRHETHWNPEVFEVLAKYNVDRRINHAWIVRECCSEAPQYVQDFLDTCVIV